MKYLTKAGLLTGCLFTAYALYAFFESSNPANKWSILYNGTSSGYLAHTVKQLPQVDNSFEMSSDSITGLRIMNSGSNTLMFTPDISQEVPYRLMEHLTSTAFFTHNSTKKMILGKEPYNYVMFYEVKNTDTIPYKILQVFISGISANVFNHQPLVLKMINEEREVVRIVTGY